MLLLIDGNNRTIRGTSGSFVLYLDNVDIPLVNFVSEKSLSDDMVHENGNKKGQPMDYTCKECWIKLSL